MTTSAAVAAKIEQQPREAAPFVKWAGGKGRLLSQLRPLLPKGVKHMRHVEPFVGGGALFFSRRPRRALLTDINPVLVDTYEAIRDDVATVIANAEIDGQQIPELEANGYYMIVATAGFVIGIPPPVLAPIGSRWISTSAVSCWRARARRSRSTTRD